MAAAQKKTRRKYNQGSKVFRVPAWSLWPDPKRKFTEQVAAINRTMLIQLGDRMGGFAGGLALMGFRPAFIGPAFAAV